MNFLTIWYGTTYEIAIPTLNFHFALTIPSAMLYLIIVQFGPRRPFAILSWWDILNKISQWVDPQNSQFKYEKMRHLTYYRLCMFPVVLIEPNTESWISIHFQRFDKNFRFDWSQVRSHCHENDVLCESIMWCVWIWSDQALLVQKMNLSRITFYVSSEV